jgi:hypothetical protein
VNRARVSGVHPVALAALFRLYAGTSLDSHSAGARGPNSSFHSVQDLTALYALIGSR